MTEPALIIEQNANNVVTLKLNRPNKHNAFDDSIIQEISDTLEDLKEKDIRLLILTGEGKSFSAGADLNWMRRMKEYTQEENYQDSKALLHMLERLINFPAPTLAVINGSAFGGGVGLIACCDIAISNQDAKFSFSEAKLGLIPAVISSYVIKAIGLRQSKKLFLTAELFSAQQAKDYGLIHEVCEKDKLDATRAKYEKLILSNGPNALREVKEIIQLNERTCEVDIHDLMVERIANIRIGDEAQEGLTAFLDKRKPNWTQNND